MTASGRILALCMVCALFLTNVPARAGEEPPGKPPLTVEDIWGDSQLTGELPSVNPSPDVAYIAKAASREAAGRFIDQAIGFDKNEGSASEDGAPPTLEDTGSEMLKKGLGELLR